MSDYRIIDADGHVMELDEQLREHIGPPYRDLEWHRSYSFWPGLTMDGYLRSLRKPGGWAGGGTGPSASDWIDFLDKNLIELTVLYPGHGPEVGDPQAKIAEYIAHRQEREDRLVAALDRGVRSRGALLAEVWDDVPEELRMPAGIAMEAHLEKLADEGRLPEDLSD